MIIPQCVEVGGAGHVGLERGHSGETTQVDATEKLLRQPCSFIRLAPLKEESLRLDFSHCQEDE
jgi:hypothetical protein